MEVANKAEKVNAKFPFDFSMDLKITWNETHAKSNSMHEIKRHCEKLKNGAKKRIFNIDLSETL